MIEMTFERLLREAVEAPVQGWDFSHIAARYREDLPPWNYRILVQRHMRSASSLLDMGTGGGEFLASLAPLPPQTFATEAYPPNVPVAQTRLQPLGVEVRTFEDENALPFQNGQFELVINRHESYSFSEVARILRPGGRFITQQVGHLNDIELNLWLAPHLPEPELEWDLEEEALGLEQAGLRVVDIRQAVQATHFYDIGAIVYYLRLIPWQIPDFSIDAYRPQLQALHERLERENELAVRNERLLLQAVKPLSKA